MKNRVLNDLPKLEYIWQDRKRILGMPISFTRYRLSSDRIFLEVGLVNTRCDEVLLYRVRDISVSIGFFQKLFGVGNVIVDSTDKSASQLLLKNVKKPRQVKELIHKKVEAAKLENRVRISEYMGAGGLAPNQLDSDGDGIPDYLDNN